MCLAEKWEQETAHGSAVRVASGPAIGTACYQRTWEHCSLRLWFCPSRVFASSANSNAVLFGICLLARYLAVGRYLIR